ncbi:MAG: DUF6457 domain-containing protein [Solirubrobacterales bacterium]
MTAEEWVQRFAREVDVEAPSREDFEAVLRLAAAAAHGSERTAAPVASWLAGRTGRPIAELAALAEGLESD